MRLRSVAATGFLLLATGFLEAQETSFRGFADVQFWTNDRQEESSSFGLGQFDLYITSDITDRVSALGEIVFEFESNGESVADLERVVIKYTWRDDLSVSVGKHHTPIGFWNTAYHHGSVLQPTIARPLMFRFEDEGGILPIHTTGILVSGSNLGGHDFGYEILVGNGIGSTAIRDNDSQKSLAIALTARPHDGTRVYFSAYVDHISAGTQSLKSGGGALTDDVKQRLLTASIVYKKRPYELVLEYLNASNKATGLERATSNAFYVYGGISRGKLVPYARYEQITFDKDDPYFDTQDVKELIVGLRYELGALALVRGEYRRWDYAEGTDSNEAAFQFAVGF